MSTPLTLPDRSPASGGLLTTKPLDAAGGGVPLRADIDPAMLAGPRNGHPGARRCSLTLIPLCSPAGDEAGRSFPDAHAHAPASPHPLRMHVVPQSTLLPFLQRPQEVAALLCDSRNAALLNALKASPAWEQVQRILPMQRDEMSDARWLSELRSALGERGQNLCNDLMRCLGADDVSLDEYASDDAMDTDTDSEHDEHGMLQRHDAWATQVHDTFASDESDDEAMQDDEEPTQDEEMSASEHSLATSTPALSVEALHAVPDGWVGPQRAAFAAAAQQAATSASATPSPGAASPGTSRAGLGTVDWSGTHDRRSSARSLPDIQEEGATPMLEKPAPSFAQQVDEKLESQQTQAQHVEAAAHARHRRLSTSLDDAPREEIENILESGIVGLRFVTDMPPLDDTAAHEVPAADVASPPASLSTPGTPSFKQHRRLSALFAPMTPIDSPPGAHRQLGSSSAAHSPRATRSRSSSLAHSDAGGEDEHKGTRGVPLTSRRRLSFARSFAELAESRSASTVTADNGSTTMRRRHSVLSRTAEASGTKVLRGRSNTTCGYAQDVASASQRRHARAHTQPVSPTTHEGVSLHERAAALEAAGEEKPSWLGLLPDGRTRHPSAGSSKAGTAGLEAFRASLGMARADSEAGSSAAGSASGNTSPMPQSAKKDKEQSKETPPTALAQTGARAAPPAPLSTLPPRKRSGSGGMGLKSPPLQPATPLAPLMTPKRSPPSPTEASGFALGGGFSFKKSGEHYKPSPKPSPAPVSSDDMFDLSSPPFLSQAAAVTAQGSSPHTPAIHRRKGGFTTFSREYEKTQRERRVRAASATSVDSVAYSTGSQVVASDDESEAFSPFGAGYQLGAQSQQDKGLSPAPAGAGAEAPSPGARVSALGLSGMGAAAPPLSPGSSGGKVSSPSAPQEGRSAPMSIPGRSAAHEEGRPSFALSSDFISPRRPSAAELSTHGDREKHVAWNVPSISVGEASPTAAAPASSAAYVPPSPGQACIRSEPRATIIFPIAPAHSRAVELARMLRHPRASSALEHARSIVGADAVSRAVLMLSTTERAALCDAALLERVARETFGLVDHAATSARASEETRTQADEKLCEEGYEARWDAFERFAKEACGVEDDVIGEAKARCGPALCLFSPPAKAEESEHTSNTEQKD